MGNPSGGGCRGLVVSDHSGWQILACHGTFVHCLSYAAIANPTADFVLQLNYAQTQSLRILFVYVTRYMYVHAIPIGSVH